MGLSILIPVFNYDVEGLVRSLTAQVQQTGIASEIILLDDGSAEHFVSLNSKLIEIPGVYFHANEENKGRMAARLQLASLARFPYLLFIDADSEIIVPGFLAVYFEQLGKNVPVVSGGRVYGDRPACEFRLHWEYGKKRERGNKRDSHGFMSNNFMVQKDLFFSLDHSVVLTAYGHEDSWWGIQFELKKISVLHIVNPVLHGHLETSVIFLAKSTLALKNILTLEQNADRSTLSRHIKIYRVYRRLKKTGMAQVFSIFEQSVHSRLKKNLLSCHPRLFYFDCYRLGELIRMY